ncbi:MAG: hypothetical protein PHQ81_05035 [Methanofollis sp.]|nr:hypothetical protein [Methanofollis sp.]
MNTNTLFVVIDYAFPARRWEEAKKERDVRKQSPTTTVTNKIGEKTAPPHREHIPKLTGVENDLELNFSFLNF